MDDLFPSPAEIEKEVTTIYEYMPLDAVADVVGEQITSIMTAATTSLRTAFREVYWPATGPNESAEATTALHVPHALRDAEFTTFSEVPLLDENRVVVGHTDLLGLQRSPRLGLAIEAKRLYSSEKATEMAMDWARLGWYQLPMTRDPGNDGDESEHEGMPFFRCLVATTWSTDIAEWWGNKQRGDHPGSRFSGIGWSKLVGILRAADGVGTSRIQEVGGEEQWLLWACDRLEAGLFG